MSDSHTTIQIRRNVGGNMTIREDRTLDPLPEHLDILEAKTLSSVADYGRSADCSKECQSLGPKCPPKWCEAVYQRLRKEQAP